jgi:hypothetical protein
VRVNPKKRRKGAWLVLRPRKAFKEQLRWQYCEQLKAAGAQPA